MKWSTRLLKSILYRVISIVVQVLFVRGVLGTWSFTPLIIGLNIILIVTYAVYDRMFEYIANFVENAGIRKLYPRVPLNRKIKAIIANARPFTLILPLFGGYFIIQASLGRFEFPTPDPLRTILAILSMMLVNATGNYWNSIFDVDIDRINKPYRPLPSGLISKNEAWLISTILACLSVVFSYFVGQTFFALALATLLITALYSMPPVRFKARLWFNNISQALIRGVLGPVSMWVVYSAFDQRILALSSVLFLLIVFGQSVKDIPDVEGDRKFNIRTIPVVYGIKKCYWIVASGTIVATLVLIGEIIYGVISWIVLAFYLPFAFLLVYTTFKPKMTVTENQLSWTVFYVTMVSVIFGFFVSSI